MKKQCLLGCILLLFSMQVSAVDVGVGAKAGSNGYGLELSFGVTDDIGIRLMSAQLDVDGEDETITVGDDGFEGDVDSELDFDYGAAAVFVDWFVFGNSFHITVGAFQNNGEADLEATLVDNVVIDGQALATDDLGPISGEVSLGDSVQPYLGVGWGRKFDGGLSLSVDVGVALLDPEVEFNATVNGGGTNGYSQAELDAILRDMERDAEDELDEYELWPVLTIGLNYAF